MTAPGAYPTVHRHQGPESLRAPCVDRLVLQTLIDLDPGDYDLLIEGVYDTGTDDVACYQVIYEFSVDGDFDEGTIVVPFNDGKDPFCDGLNPI